MTIDEPLAEAVPVAAKRMGIGKSTLWKLIADGEISVVRVGGRTLVTIDAQRA